MNKKIDKLLKAYNLAKYVDRFIISEPLGVIPYDLSYYFPAAHYDYPPAQISNEEVPIYINLIRSFIAKISNNYELSLIHI